MILDKYLSFDQKVKIAIVAGSIWIYFRTFECYKLLPRKSIISVILVSLWIYKLLRTIISTYWFNNYVYL